MIGSDRHLARLALVVACIAATGLAGCGRKGPLEAPPSASLSQPQAVQPPPSLGEPEQSQPFGRSAEAGPAAPPPQAPPPKKSFLLDWLLN